MSELRLIPANSRMFFSMSRTCECREGDPELRRKDPNRPNLGQFGPNQPNFGQTENGQRNHKCQPSQNLPNPAENRPDAFLQQEDTQE